MTASSKAKRCSRPPLAGKMRAPSGVTIRAPMRLPSPAARKVPLLAERGAKGDARGEIDQHPGIELAVGDGLADVRVLHAGSDIPVDAADVVAE